MNPLDIASLGKDLRNVDLRDMDLRNVNLHEADLRGAKLYRANLVGSDLRNVDLTLADLREANLAGANLSGSDMTCVYLLGANLTGANLSGVDISGSRIVNIGLKSSIFADVIGVGTKSGEIEFSKNLLATIAQNVACFDMDHWCGTAKCIAGHACPGLSDPSRKASTLYPTLSQYFFVDGYQALNALKRVANGEESVFP